LYSSRKLLGVRYDCDQNPFCVICAAHREPIFWTSLELSQAVYPRAHTCFNRIDVPLYRTKEELVAGFEFVLELGDQTFTMD